MVVRSRQFEAEPVLLNIGFGPHSRVPGPNCYRRGLLEDDYHAAARRVAALNGVALLDFVGSQLDEKTMLDEFHPGAEGYHRIAEGVIDLLLANHLLVSPATATP